jgi:hypothetical protein
MVGCIACILWCLPCEVFFFGGLASVALRMLGFSGLHTCMHRRCWVRVIYLSLMYLFFIALRFCAFAFESRAFVYVEEEVE